MKATIQRRLAGNVNAGFLINLAFLLTIHSYASAQTTIAFAGVDTLVDKALNLVYDQKYDEAIALCEQVIQKYPENPLGYFGHAAVYHLYMMSYRVNIFDDKFDSLAALTIEIGDRAVLKNVKDPNAHFVLGATYGFRGLNRIRKGQWFKAFLDGVKGVSNIKQAHSLDESLWDTYFGLGLYYYWKSSKARVLTFLRMMKDEREKGIEYLKIAGEKGRFTALESKISLVEIFYYEDRYEEALAECFSIQHRFRDDPTWNYITAKTLTKLGRYSEAKQYFAHLIQLLEKAEHQSNSYLGECFFGLAKCYFELKQYDQAKEFLVSAKKLVSLKDTEREIEGPLLDYDLVIKRMDELEIELSLING
ncbi:MAG: tetratricopeptide repeat protein [Candidatus Zhuqueibacterota bacterium]